MKQNNLFGFWLKYKSKEISDKVTKEPIGTEGMLILIINEQASNIERLEARLKALEKEMKMID
jgi:hypothetical protein